MEKNGKAIEKQGIPPGGTPMQKQSAADAAAQERRERLMEKVREKEQTAARMAGKDKVKNG